MSVTLTDQEAAALLGRINAEPYKQSDYRDAVDKLMRREMRNSHGQTLDEFVRATCKLPMSRFRQVRDSCADIAKRATDSGDHNLAEFYAAAARILNGPAFECNHPRATHSDIGEP